MGRRVGFDEIVMDERCIQGLVSVPASARGCVLTIGNFDGVHLGHRLILATARALADAAGLQVVAMTFEPPPNLVLHPDDPPRRISPPRHRARLLLETGADLVVTARTDVKLLGMDPAEFIERIIVRHFAPRHIVEGRNFSFGRKRAGNVDVLRDSGGAHGFALQVVDPVTVALAEGPRVISSTLIRDLILSGRVADATRGLDREFALYGTVARGAGQGRLLEFPTVNLTGGSQVVPLDGVYAGLAEIAGGRYPAAISVGTKPTLGPGPLACEAHLIGAEGDFYDQALELRFVKRLRGQEKFDRIDALRSQIAKDVADVREICG